MLSKRRYVFGAAAVVLGTACLLLFGPNSRINTSPLPSRYSDSEFWRMITDVSENGGFFRSDNFVSNETSFQHVIPELKRKTKPGGVYVGVGPDQNFTYAVALQPKVAFILDIRRQNMLQHLLYKSLIELSANRTQFLGRLFSRPIPDDLPPDPSAQELLAAFNKSVAAKDLFETNYREVMNRLIGVHHFALEADDAKTIEYIYRAFFTAGPDIRYSFPSQYGYRRFPTYTELMLESDLTGQNHSYLATEENYQTLKEMQEENRIIPLVGDFAGDKALRRLGQYLDEHGTTVTAFYTSNVEYYLFQSEDWRKFFNNVTSLPLDANSTFIRAYFSGLRFPPQNGGVRPETLLDNIADLLEAFNHGDIRSYDDVVQRSLTRIP
jgi:hypothetical protein